MKVAVGQDAGPLNLAAGERKGRHLLPQIRACIQLS